MACVDSDREVCRVLPEFQTNLDSRLRSSFDIIQRHHTLRSTGVPCLEALTPKALSPLQPASGCRGALRRSLVGPHGELVGHSSLHADQNQEVPPKTSGQALQPEAPVDSRRCLEETACQRARTKHQCWPFAIQGSQSRAGEACDLIWSGKRWSMSSLHTCAAA